MPHWRFNVQMGSMQRLHVVADEVCEMQNGNASCVDRESEDTDDTNQPSEPSSEASSEPSSESDGDVDETDEKGTGVAKWFKQILGSSL